MAFNNVEIESRFCNHVDALRTLADPAEMAGMVRYTQKVPQTPCVKCGHNLPITSLYPSRLRSLFQMGAPVNLRCSRCYKSTKAECDYIFVSARGLTQGMGDLFCETIRTRKLPCRTANSRYDITVGFNELANIWVKQKGRCALSGVSMNDARNSPSRASLDRIDSSVGYVPGNIQWLCYAVNTMKMAMIQSDFVAWCRAVGGNAKR